MVNLIHCKNRDQCLIVLDDGLACMYEYIPKKNNENNDRTSIFTSSNFKKRNNTVHFWKLKTETFILSSLNFKKKLK